MGLQIKGTSAEDLETILAIHKAAFGQDDEAELTSALLGDPSAHPVLSLLAYEGACAVGHILFTAVRIGGFEDVSSSILAPLAVIPEAQKSGVGSALITAGLAYQKETHTKLGFVLGDPGYYGRFGFRPAMPIN